MATKSKKSKEITIRSSAAEYLTFVSAIGDQPESVELRYQDENLWLTQRLMAELYGVDVRTINEHILKIYSDKELEEEATIRNFQIVQAEGSHQVSCKVKQFILLNTRSRSRDLVEVCIAQLGTPWNTVIKMQSILSLPSGIRSILSITTHSRKNGCVQSAWRSLRCSNRT